MAYEYQTLFGKLAGRAGVSFSSTWQNPSWWNLCIAMPWALGAVFLIYQWSVDSRIARRQRTAVGTICTHEPANHDRYGYTFEVDGKPYDGREIPKHAGWVLGQQVLVYYDPLNPGKNALTDFYELSTSDLGPVPVLLVGVGTVAIIIFNLRRHSRRASIEQTK